MFLNVEDVIVNDRLAPNPVIPALFPKSALTDMPWILKPARFHKDLCQSHSGNIVVVDRYPILSLKGAHQSLPS